MKVVERVKRHWKYRLKADDVLTWQDPERMSGAICVYGTRFPVAQIFEHLDMGYSLEDLFEWYLLGDAKIRIRKIIDQYYN